MALNFSAEEVLSMQATLRHVRSELDSLSYAVNENVARLQQVWGYLELRIREMDRKQVGDSSIYRVTLMDRFLQHEPVPETPVTPTPPKKLWENVPIAAEARGRSITRKNPAKDGK